MAQHDVYVLVLSPLTLIHAPRKTEKKEEVKWGGGGGADRQTDGWTDGSTETEWQRKWGSVVGQYWNNNNTDNKAN